MTPDIVDRLLDAQREVVMTDEVLARDGAPFERERDRLAALLRELHVAIKPFVVSDADLEDRPDDGYIHIGKSSNRLYWRDWRRLRAAVEACSK